MKIEVLPDAAAVAQAGAAFVAAEARAAVAARGRALVAFSGGHTPWQMLDALAREDAPWGRVHVLQVDERVAPAGHPDRNATHLRQVLLGRVPLPPEHAHLMSVEAPDLTAAAAQYAETLAALAGSPPTLDLIHLGLGPDGHTASLVPGDPALNVMDASIAITREYQGRRRLTLTYPVLNHARRILWLITGADKAGMLVHLRNGDPGIPAGRVRADRAVVLADAPAAAQLAGPGSAG